MKRFFIILLLSVLALSGAQAENAEQRNSQYAAYVAQYADVPLASQAMEGSFVASSVEEVDIVQGEQALCLSGGDWIAYTITVPQEARYALSVRYCALPGTVQDVEIAVEIDGALPFAQAAFCVLPRVWEDNGPFTLDNSGNQIRPGQLEVPLWREETLYDYDGVTDGEYLFDLTGGQHTIRLTLLSEPAAIGGLTLTSVSPAPAWEELKASYAAQGLKEVASGIYIERQAEDTYRRYALYPLAESDYTSPSTVPSSPTKIVYNVLGGEQWVFTKQRVEWRFEAPETGLYQLNFKYRQNYARGMAAYRKILVDGTLPCEEMRAVSFPYGDDWQNLTVSAGDEPILLYLEAGEHTVSLSPAIRPISGLLGTLEDAVYELNAWYRSIITVTSTTPDLYRDYYLNKEVPGLMEGFASISQRLTDTANAYEAMLGVQGSELSVMHEAAKQLDDFVKRADRIPERLTEFKNNISALTDLRRNLMELPMQLDDLSLSSPGAALPAPSKGFLETAWFRLQAFIGSFTENYNAVGNVYDGEGGVKPLEVLP